MACQSHRASAPDTLVIAVEAYPQQLDPRLANDAISSKIKRLVFSGLMAFDESLNVVPDLAESFEHPDDLTYILKLKTGLSFHDGTPLTSADVKATYESMAAPELASPYRGTLDIIEKIATPDARTVQFRLKKPFLPFLTVLTYVVLPKRLAERLKAIPREELVGSGPFAIAENQGHEEKLNLVRFDRFYGTRAKIKNLVIWTLQDNTLRAMELMKGRIDLVQNAIPYVLTPEMKVRDNLQMISDVGVNFNYLAFNFKNEHLKNRLVRQAIAMSIDRDRIIQYKLFGLARPADSLLNPRHWAYAKGLQPIVFNIEAAKKLLDEAGYPDPDGDGPEYRFALTYKTSTNKERLEIVQLIADNMRRIGIDVTIRSYEFGTLYRDIRQGDFDVFSMTWVGISDPDIFHTIFHSSQIPPTGANRGFYVHAEVDRLLDRSRLESDEAKRTAIFQSVQKIIHEDFVYVPLWYDDNFAVMNRSVKGYRLRPDASFYNVVEAYKE